MKQVLVVSAHPDDMEIGMGGTVAKMIAAGQSVASLILTDGRRSPNPFSFPEEQIIQIRRKEAENAASVLGISELVFCDLPDLKSEANANRAIDQAQNMMQRLSPEEIYVLHPELDRHATHRLSGRLVISALQASKQKAAVWAYEVWGLFPRWDRFEDISSYVGPKVRAIGEHKSQIAAVSYTEGVLGLNRWRAVFADPEQDKANATFAEVFIRLKPEM